MATDNQITFKYKFPETYNPVYVNGAHGGINVQGEIIANFYMERTPLPNKVTNNLNTDGSLSDVVSILPEDTSSPAVSVSSMSPLTVIAPKLEALARVTLVVLQPLSAFQL